MSIWDWSTTAGTNSGSDAAINWAEGQLPSTVNNSARAMMAALKAFVQDTGGVTTAGSSNAYTVTLSQTMLSASKGIIGIIADRANTGAATLNVDSLGAYPLRMVSGTDLSAGDIVEGCFYIVTWESGASEWLILSTAPQAASLAPGGRLTLTSGTPVLTSTVSGATTVYYTPYLHDMVPIWNGSTFIPTRFAELSQTTADSTKSPAAVTTSSNYDVFVWSDSGTLRATRGPAWSSGTSRGTGAGTTQLTRVRGILTNTVAITNGPAAGYGTYVGTIRSNASSQIDFILGGSASGGTAGVLNVWNMYNRVDVVATVTDTQAGYTYSSATVRSAGNSATNRVSFVTGSAEDGISVVYNAQCTLAGSLGAYTQVGVGVDSTSAFYQQAAVGQNPTTTSFGYAASYAMNTPPLLGSHFLQALEGGDGSANNGFNATQSNAFSAKLRM